MNGLAHLFRERLLWWFGHYGLDLTIEEYRILCMLMDGDGMSQKEIGECTIKEKTTVTRQLEKLVQKGYVERREDVHDRRITRIFLTDKGHGIRKKLYDATQRVLSEAEKGISKDDLTCFKETAFRMRQSLGELATEN